MNKGIIILLGFFAIHVALNGLHSESTFSVLLPYLLLLIALLVAHYSRSYSVFQNLDFRNLSLSRTLLFGVGLFIIGGLGYVITGLLNIEIYDRSNMNNSSSTIISIAIAAAFLEELFFRGFLLQELRNHIEDRAALIIISSLLFSLFHLSKGQYISTFLIGLALAFITLKYKNISLTISTHLVYNLIGLSMYHISNK